MARSCRQPSVTAKLALVLVSALLLAACSSGSSGAGPVASAEAVASSGSAAGVALDPQIVDFLALDVAGQEAALAELSASLERQLWTETGMEKELGGPAATDEAFAALSSEMVGEALTLRDRPSFGRFGARPVMADEVALGGLLFGGYMIAALGADAVVSATSALKPGTTESNKDSDAGSTADVTGTLEGGALDTTIEKTVDGVTGKLRTRVEVAACPDATGTFVAKVLIDASSTTTGGRSGSNVSTEVEVTGHVDDSAELAGSETVTRTQAAKFQASKGSFVDVTTTSVRSGGEFVGFEQAVNRAGGAATAEMAQEWANFGTMTEALAHSFALGAAEKGWKSGRCVDLKATTTPGQRTGLKPSAAVSILAQPLSKIDGKPTGGTVTATLAGDSSVDPSGSPVPADATFSYVAPGEKDKTASVGLESRSKRGIGKAQVDFDTNVQNAYTVVGGATGLSIDQAVCDITKAFTLDTADFSLLFSGGLTGTYTYTGVYNASGQGTYAITFPDGPGQPGTMVGAGPGVIMDAQGSGTENYVLTPLAACP